MPYEPVLLKNVGKPNSQTLAAYRASGGYKAVEKAMHSKPEEVVEFVKKANLRGRGGAGFPAGVKWSFLPPNRDTTYLVVNGDESEPPTFSNRVIMENDPHLLLEGILIAGYAIKASVAYIYLRGEFTEVFHRVQKAVDECYAAGLFGSNILGSGWSMDCYVCRGAGAYICGEETGLIESLEGKRGWPRIKPPFPAVEGAFRKPTVVNNVETLACLVPIFERGLEWWNSLGPDGSKGTKLYCISGPVKRPGCYEAPVGISVRELIYSDDFGGGMLDNMKVKACGPGGISMGFLRGDLFPKRDDGQVNPREDYDELDCRLDFDDVRRYDLLGLGTSSAVVVGEHADIRDVLVNCARFFAHESCGQCTQCREGTGWMYKIAKRLRAGAGRPYDLDLLIEVTQNMGMMPGLSICGLPDGAAWPIRTLAYKFRKEFERHIAAQPPDAALRFARSVNPAAYELPVLSGRAVQDTGGTFMLLTPEQVAAGK